VSNDGGATFHLSNDGFTERQITAVVADVKHPSELFASVLNDKEFGGVFRSHEGGWLQMSDGLGGRDVFDLGQSPEGKLVAATNRGLYLLDAKSQRWELSKDVVSEKPAPERKPVRGKNGKMITPKALPPIVTHTSFEGRATGLALGGKRWYAATEAGVLVSENEGKSWKGGAVDGEKSFLSISSHDDAVAAATLRDVWYSSDEAEHWSHQPVPAWVTRVYSVNIANDGAVWVGSREGALRWTPGKGEWEHVLSGLPGREVFSIHEKDGVMLAAAAGSKTMYVSRNQGQSWKAEPASSFEVTGAAVQDGTIYVTTRHHGVLVREMQATSAAGLH
jgi:hypothetical protein